MAAVGRRRSRARVPAGRGVTADRVASRGRGRDRRVVEASALRGRGPSTVRWARGGARAGDYAASLGKVPLPVAELTGRVAGLAGLATRLGLDLDALYLLQTAARVGTGEGGGKGRGIRKVSRKMLRRGSHDKGGRGGRYQLSQEVTSRGRFLWVWESWGASSTKRRLSIRWWWW
jgi:hypothetical protein